MSRPDWDALYQAAPEGLFGQAPSRWLRMAVAREDGPPASALALADGDGRNGRWLAKLGAKVTAVDISAVATRRAEALDAAAALSVTRICADVVKWRPDGDAAFDLVAILFLQGPAELRLAALRTGAAALAPGGALVLEGFANPVRAAGPGPSRPEARYGLDETVRSLGGVVVEEALTGVVMLDEGPRHQGAATILRVIARRPADSSLPITPSIAPG